MFMFERSIWVNRTQQDVFSYLSEPANDREWRDSNVSSEWISDPPHGVGSSYHSVDKFLGRKMEGTTEHHIWDAPDKIGFKSGSGPMSFQFTATLESKENGTQLTFSGQAKLAGLFKMAEGLAGKQMEKQLAVDMDGFKRVMEGGMR